MFIPTALDAIRTTTGEMISHQYVFSRRMRMGEVVVSSVKHFKLHCMVIMNCMFSYIMHMYRYCARYQFIIKIKLNRKRFVNACIPVL